MQLFSDQARAELSTTLGVADTTLSISAFGEKFPVANVGTGALDDGDWFKVVLDGGGDFEIVYVRTHASGSGTMSHLLRAQEGTTAQEWQAGTVVGLRVTSADLERFDAKADQSALGTAAYEDVPASGDASPSQVVLGSDSRLTDARTPTSHTHTIANVTGLQAALDGKADTYTDTSTSANKTLADRERCAVTAAGKTVALPASPTTGMTCVVLVGDFDNTVIARNGSTIMGLAENLTVDVPNVGVTLVFNGTTWRIA